MNPTAGKLLYGILFTTILPLLLVLWTIGTEPAVHLPSIQSIPAGIALSAVGVVMMGAGMLALWTRGGGLPMNAFPPPNFVASGVYSLVYHPIYTGFVLVCAGVSIVTGSASGLWLTTPTVALASAALVLGYELPDMQKRFQGRLSSWRFLPADEDGAPSATERLRFCVTVLVPWLVAYEAVVTLGIPSDARIAYLPFEHYWPVWQWSELFYFSVYPAVIVAAFLVPTRAALRRLWIQALASMALVFPIFLAIPLISPPRPFVATSGLGNLLNFDRAHDSAAAAFPSYHVIWALMVAQAMAGGVRRKQIVWWAWAVLVSISCVTTGMHALVDVIAGFLVVALLLQFDRMWEFVRATTERIANSWREWRLGPVRIINHGVYAAAAAFVGVLIMEICLGRQSGGMPIIIFAMGLVGAAIWAQLIEGSSVLLRPLGFYGGLIGSIIGAVSSAAWTHTSPWLALAALSVAGPWIQGLGRLRCLVQGCCHGRATEANLGIRYLHPRSRVSRIAELRGLPVHATPLYSILWLVLVALAVSRLYILHVNAAMIGGLNLILTGCGRFVEEAYRGEPQTPTIAGLRLYQWLAIATIIGGAIVTTFTGAPVPAPLEFQISALPIALACGLVAGFVASVDFPESNRRFARLT